MEEQLLKIKAYLEQKYKKEVLSHHELSRELLIPVETIYTYLTNRRLGSLSTYDIAYYIINHT